MFINNDTYTTVILPYFQALCFLICLKANYLFWPEKSYGTLGFKIELFRMQYSVVFFKFRLMKKVMILRKGKLAEYSGTFKGSVCGKSEGEVSGEFP